MKLDYITIEDKDEYLKLISEFNYVELTDSQWDFFFDSYEESDTRVIYLAKVFDKSQNSEVVIGTASILVESKAHRNLMACIHVEDVVINKKYRGLGLGKLMMQEIVREAKSYNAYKLILDCDELKNGEFYFSCGFYPKETQYRLDLL